MSPAEASRRGVYRIDLAGEWSLEDLYSFPHAYGQLYSFVNALQRGRLEIDEAYERPFEYPWRGGWSTVNFFSYVASRVPRTARPRLLAMQYASPGWMDLSLVIASAIAIRTLVTTFVKAATQLHALYNDIYKGMHDRKLMQVDVRERLLELEEKELAWIETSTDKIAKLMGFKDVATLSTVTRNPLATLKLVLSLYRRVRTLAKYEESGKANL
jgi:hypothetical protein